MAEAQYSELLAIVAWQTKPTACMGLADFKSVSHHRWDRIPEESLKGTITRRLVTGERMMIAHVYLKKGDDVPRHSHENERNFIGERTDCSIPRHRRPSRTTANLARSS